MCKLVCVHLTIKPKKTTHHVQTYLRFMENRCFYISIDLFFLNLFHSTKTLEHVDKFRNVSSAHYQSPRGWWVCACVVSSGQMWANRQLITSMQKQSCCIGIYCDGDENRRPSVCSKENVSKSYICINRKRSIEHKMNADDCCSVLHLVIC